jgi:hypothetical protein
MKGNLPRIHTTNIIGAGIDNAILATVTGFNVGRSVGDAITTVVAPILQIAKNISMYF